jgi:signal transduction histidine kinase
MAAEIQQSERVPLTDFMTDVGVVGHFQAENRNLQLAIEVAPHLTVIGDPQLLSSAVMNLLNNAFKYTPAGGRVVLRARREDERVLIEVEDECGGVADGADDPFKAFAVRRKGDRTGLGLGLSIARKAVRMHGGEIHHRNIPGKGCVFVIDLPLAADTPIPLAPG